MRIILRRCLKNVNLLNMALLAVAITLWLGLSVPTTGPAGLSVSLPQPPKVKEKAKQAEANPSMADFTVVADNNLFHPERRIPPEKNGETAEVKPEIVLYGTMMNDDVRVAFIEDRKSPRTTPGRGQRQLTAKKGDVFGGFAITSIEADRISLAKGGETMVVPLTDPEKRRSTDAPKAPSAPAAAQAGAPRRPAPVVPPADVTPSPPSPQPPPAARRAR